MGTPQGAIGKHAEKLCREMPHATTRSLGFALAKEFPNHFKNPDGARSTIRMYRNENPGVKIEKTTQRKSLPESYAQGYKPYVLPDAAARILVLADLHIPYHDNEAIEAALDHGEANKATHILLNGDVMDCYMVSKHDKDPRERSIKDELNAVRQFLDVLRERFPKAKIIYKEGNHEERLSSFLRSKAPELLDCEEFRLQNLLKLQDRKIDWVGDKLFVNCGKLAILHGHELQQGMIAPVNVARGLFLKTKAIAMVSHSHQTSEHSEKDLHGKITTTWSTGCLCGLTPMYARNNKWNLGAAFIDLKKDGNFQVHNFKIINGKVY